MDAGQLRVDPHHPSNDSNDNEARSEADGTLVVVSPLSAAATADSTADSAALTGALSDHPQCMRAHNMYVNISHAWFLNYG